MTQRRGHARKTSHANVDLTWIANSAEGDPFVCKATALHVSTIQIARRGLSAMKRHSAAMHLRAGALSVKAVQPAASQPVDAILAVILPTIVATHQRWAAMWILANVTTSTEAVTLAPVDKGFALRAAHARLIH